ncbi:cytochrome c biogenesis CcdA family protein [Rummeliibacillus stabekisii]|uniref:cytochrome c biogenesis CcdA family protein n=1 Tax=Rummeliibacillus stabekisii TaxID=241244 RepID=UPI00371DD2A0
MVSDISLILAFGAGLLNFMSPCSLPLYPAFISYISGMTLDELKGDKKFKKASILHTVSFLLGFSVIFIFIGYSSSIIGTFFYQYQDLLRRIGAVFIVIFGLIIIGFIQPKFIMTEKRVQFKSRPSGYFGSFLIGLAFSAGWTPCTGPITGAVFMMASQNPDLGIIYMTVYVLGFAIPFFILSFFITKIAWIRKYSQRLTIVGGYIMITIGFILYFDGLRTIIIWSNKIFGSFTGF